MARPNPLWQLTLLKVREITREPEAVFWVFAFPVLLALALGIAFRAKGPELVPVAVAERPGAAAVAAALGGADGITVARLPVAEALRKLHTGAVAIVVEPGDPPTYRFDPTRPESLAARLAVDDALQRANGREDVFAARLAEEHEAGSRYIDFLIPGLLGMNLMGTGMWGIGFSIVNARSKHLLKRMIAAPMRRGQFLAAQMLGRLVFLVAEVAVLVGFARIAFGVPLRGSLATFSLVCLAGAVCFAGIGLLVAARPRTIEGVSGVMNVVMLPMWIGSGTFFSTERFPDAVQPALQLLPLTAVNDALRGVMLDGSGLSTLAPELALIGGWTVVCFVLALRLFRWS